MKDNALIALKYGLFAVIATIVNIAAQEFVFRVCGLDSIVKIIDFVRFVIPRDSFIFVGALGFGTLMGLVVKYILDKRYIFYYETSSKSEDVKKFGVYTLMGIVTTVIFWGSETIFHLLWDEKYLGAITGLMVGYISKYFLDRKFVFK